MEGWAKSTGGGGRRWSLQRTVWQKPRSASHLEVEIISISDVSGGKADSFD